jgi:hypothetical protein
MIKKITLTLLLLTSFIALAQFPEDFSTLSGTTFPTGWTTFVGTNGLGTVENWKQNGTSEYAFCKWEGVTAGAVAEDWLVTPQFTVDATQHFLSFSNVVFNTQDYGSILTVRVSTASQTTHADFTIVDTQTETAIRNGATTSFFTNHVVDLNSYIGQTIYVAFVWAQNDGDAIAIDNVDMVAGVNASLNIAETPTPADTATDVEVFGGDANADGNADNSVSLSWAAPTGGETPTGYKIYVGTSAASLGYAGTFTNTSVTWGDRVLSTTYYWKVVPFNNNGYADNCPVWSFTTAATAVIQEEGEVNLFSIYPNPASDILNINTTKQLESVTIFNQLGQEVYNLKTTAISNAIDISNLKKGLYIMNVRAEGKTQAIKFIKK